MGLVLIHGDIIEQIPSLTSADRLEYRLTMAIQKLNDKISALVGLTDKIKVKLFLSSSLNAVAPYMRIGDLSQLPEKLESIVKNLNAKMYGKLEYEYFDPGEGQDIESELEKYNIMNLQWPALLDGKIQAGKGFIGLIMERGQKVVQLPLLGVTSIPLIGSRYNLADLEKMEETINEHLESLLNINEDAGYLMDHGTLRLLPNVPQGGYKRPDAISNFPSVIGKNYNLKHVRLSDDTISGSFNSLIIAAPQEDFTDYELFQIDQFLMRGKSLAIFLNTFKESPNDGEEGVFISQDTSLEKLLEHYGLRIKKSLVMDESCYQEDKPADMGGGKGPIHFVPIIKNQFINKDVEFMSNIKGLVVSHISPLELIQERITEDNLKAYNLFSSSEKSWEMSGKVNLNPLLLWPPKSEDEFKSFPLAYVLEGEFTSYFSGKPIPEKESKESDSKKKDAENQEEQEPEVNLSKIETSGQTLYKGKPGKILLIASDSVLKDNMFDPKGETTNATFIVNALDYLNNKEDIAVMRSKMHGYNPLYDISGGTKIFAKFFNIAGLPLLVVLFGLVVWFHRHSRKKRIKMMFQQ